MPVAKSPREGQGKRQFSAEHEGLLSNACQRLIEASGPLRREDVVQEIENSGPVYSVLLNSYTELKLYNKVKYYKMRFTKGLPVLVKAVSTKLKKQHEES